MLGVLLAAGLGVSCARRPAEGDAGQLIGIWSAETSFGPEARGDLTIDGRSEPWRATIGRFTVNVPRSVTQLIALPGDAGSFRGEIDDDSVIRGIWTQPRGVVHFAAYATPVELRPSGRLLWTGHVTPLDDRVRFYVVIRRVNGGLSAFIRNPQFNWLGRATYRVQVQGDAVTLTSGGGNFGWSIRQAKRRAYAASA